jgi:hypothetical protein
MKSLSKEAKDKILLLTAEYAFDGIYSGIALLKVIIRASHIDTNATLRYIREKLNSLDTYMVSVDSDIGKFNQQVYNLIDSLAARGATSNDLLINIFKGYAAASDKAFVAYIAKKEEDYDDGVQIEPEVLMQLAENKYKSLVEGSKWNAPDEQTEKIIALQAQVKKLAARKGKDKPGPKTPPGGGPKAGKGKGGKDDQKTPATNIKPPWMMLKPKAGEKQKKTVDGKLYHWCANHNCWTRHSPAECKGKGGGTTPKPTPKGGKSKPAPDLAVAQAYETIAEHDLEDEE